MCDYNLMNPIKQICKEANEIISKVMANEKRKFIVVAHVGPRTFRELIDYSDSISYLYPFQASSEIKLYEQYKIRAPYYAFDADYSVHGTTPIVIDPMVSYKRSSIDVVFEVI